MTSRLAEAVVAGDRRALARAITLVESNRPDHRAEATTLLDEVMPSTGGAVRVGISGAPGAGKSTLIEALGLHAIGEGHHVAVLAVDPSSSRSGGSILGDKTRMSDLGRHADAYIRPSPTGGTLGGVARRTGEALLLCEAAGFGVVLVETVGVGQSEIAVADMVDLFLLVASPAGGDELQGIKRGIMELADLIVVNKADGDLLPAAQRAASDLRKAVHLLRPKRVGWEVGLLLASALHGTGIDELWRALVEQRDRLERDGQLTELRARQAEKAMWRALEDGLLEHVLADPSIGPRFEAARELVAAGELSPSSAADSVLRAMVSTGQRARQHERPGEPSDEAR